MRFARISQWVFLALFLLLFFQTEYRGVDEINAAVNGFFRINPLVLTSFLLAAKSWSWLLFPALLMVFATALLGRFFCGWICPLGFLLDLFSRFFPKNLGNPFTGRRINLLLLSIIGFSATLGLNLAGILDPIALLLRGLTFVIHPLAGSSAQQGWTWLYTAIGEKRDYLAPGYGLLKDYILPFRQTWYPTAFLSAVLLFAVFFLERMGRRTWCRDLCPLGALLAFLARFSPVKRHPAGLCGDCGSCADICPTAFSHGSWQRQDCLLCMDCVQGCQSGRVSFVFGYSPARGGGFFPSRRAFLGSAMSGVLLGSTLRFSDPHKNQRLLRPPGVRDDRRFMAACVRCGECMKVCVKNALYPAVLQADLEGIYTPVLVPRLGYCEYNCTLCGQVCPTGAIPNLPLETKQREVIGKAVFDKNVCLPFARKTDCIVCEEHCPIPGKAIRSRKTVVTGVDGVQKSVLEPYLVEELCNGCGICENVCPLETKAGIEVFQVKDRRPIGG